MTSAIVTPWFEHIELAPDYIEALNMGPLPNEVIIADNGGAPQAQLAGLLGKCDLKFVDVGSNLGFSGGSNAGLREATADVVVMLNNDVIAHNEGWLDALVQATEPGVLTGARLVNPEHAQVDGMSMPYLDGWCLAGMREDLLELGGFDESLQEPSYYSDNLLCLEARAAGFVLREVSTGLVHKGGQTSQVNGFVIPQTAHNKLIYEKRAREILGGLVGA